MHAFRACMACAPMGQDDTMSKDRVPGNHRLAIYPLLSALVYVCCITVLNVFCGVLAENSIGAVRLWLEKNKKSKG